MRGSADNHIGLRSADRDIAARFWRDAPGGTLATTPPVHSDSGVEAVVRALRCETATPDQP
jgi:hypothetical protein